MILAGGFTSLLVGTGGASSSSSPAISPDVNETWVNASGLSCRGSILDEQRCFVGIDFSDDIGAAGDVSPEQRCWDHCHRDAYEFYVAIAYARPRDGVCCCQSSCSCLEDSGQEDDAMAIRSSLTLPDRCDLLEPFPEQEVPEIQGPILGVEMDVVEGATCGSSPALLETCEGNRELSDIGSCWQSCDNGYAAVTNGTTCCCYLECDCLRADALSVLARPQGHTVGDCLVLAEDPVIVESPESESFVAYRNAECGYSESRLNITGHGSVLAASSTTATEFVADSQVQRRCFESCQADAAANGTELAAATLSSDGTCTCLNTCECLVSGESDSISLVPSNIDAFQCVEVYTADDDAFFIFNDTTVIIEDADNDSVAILPDDAAEYEKKFDTFSHISCYSGENRLCFYNLDYAEDASDWVKRYECWSWCYNGDYAATYGNLAAAFGQIDNSECCCVSRCDCFEKQPSSRSLLSLARNISEVPGHCEEANGDSNNKKKRRVGPIDRSDIWWIVLIAIVAFVGVGFFIAVEEIDKSRRNDASLRQKTKSPFACDSDTAHDSKFADDDESSL